MTTCLLKSYVDINEIRVLTTQDYSFTNLTKVVLTSLVQAQQLCSILILIIDHHAQNGMNRTKKS